MPLISSQSCCLNFDSLLSAPPFERVGEAMEDQMDVMTTKMQLPDFSVADDNVVVQWPLEDFSHGAMFSTTTLLLQDQVPSPILSNASNDGESSNGYGTSTTSENNKRNSMAATAMREMIFRMAAMQPIHIDPESVKPPKRRNVKISKDPQSVAARHRRERISGRIRILQRLVPGGTKMDTASMLDEAIHYVKFLKTQVQSLERASANRPIGMGFPVAMSSGSCYHSLSMPKANDCYQLAPPPQNFHHCESNIEQ